MGDKCRRCIEWTIELIRQIKNKNIEGVKESLEILEEEGCVTKPVIEGIKPNINIVEVSPDAFIGVLLFDFATDISRFCQKEK